MTCDITPGSISGFRLEYDTMGSSSTALGYGDGNDLALVHFTAPSGGTLERVSTYFRYTGTTDYTVEVFGGWSGSTPNTLLTSQSGSHVGEGPGENSRPLRGLAVPRSVQRDGPATAE